MRDFGLAGPRGRASPGVGRRCRRESASFVPASLLGRRRFACLFSSLRLPALRSPPTVWFLKKSPLARLRSPFLPGNNRCSPHPRRGSFKITPPTPPSPPTAALFCLRPLFPVGLISCACHPPPPNSGLSCSLSPSSLGLGSLPKVSWVGWGGSRGRWNWEKIWIPGKSVSVRRD